MALQEEVPTFTESHFEYRHRNEASTRFENDEKKVQARGKPPSKERDSPARTILRWRTSAKIQSHRPLWFRVMGSLFAEWLQKAKPRRLRLAPPGILSRCGHDRSDKRESVQLLFGGSLLAKAPQERSMNRTRSKERLPDGQKFPVWLSQRRKSARLKKQRTLHQRRDFQDPERL